MKPECQKIACVQAALYPWVSMDKLMTRTNRNQDFENARYAKKDEFYTSLSDIEIELINYKRHFKGKTVYCNCDDPRESNFFRYFLTNFHSLGLKKLIATCYRSQDGKNFGKNNSKRAVLLEYTGDKKITNTSKVKDIGVDRKSVV